MATHPTKQMFSSVMDYLTDLIICFNIDSKILALNSAFENWINQDKKELIGKPITNIIKRINFNFYPTDYFSNLVDVECCYTNGESQQHIKWSCFPLTERNEITGFALIGKDITENKNLLSQISTLDNVIQHAPDMIYWKDKNSIHLGCNDQFAIVAGLNRHEIVGKSDYDFPWHDQAEKYSRDDKEVIESGAPKLNIEDIMPFKNGKRAVVITNKVPLRHSNGQIIGVLGIATDITERKEAEAELRKAKEKAEAAKYIMTEFISNMGHDLSTPLSDIGSVAQILNCYAEEYPELQDLFDTLVKRCEACDEVRNRIIKATSIANLEVNYETFSIIQELLALETELRPTISSKKLKLIIHPLKPKKEDVIVTDRSKFSAILRDLLSNAINFTEKGQVTVSVLKEGELFHIKVADTGIGIPSDKFDYIFEQYTKLSRSNTHGATFKGVGAGLYLARIRANILGATISVESEVNKGSTFTLSIPTHPNHK